MQGLGVYKHLHEPINSSVQPDYDHLPQHGVDDDDYSHMNSYNVNQVDSSGEYAMFINRREWTFLLIYIFSL